MFLNLYMQYYVKELLLRSVVLKRAWNKKEKNENKQKSQKDVLLGKECLNTLRFSLIGIFLSFCFWLTTLNAYYHEFLREGESNNY